MPTSRCSGLENEFLVCEGYDTKRVSVHLCAVDVGRGIVAK